MRTRFVLRLGAIAIAIAGMVDPVITLSRQAPEPLAITVLDTPSDDADRAAAQLQSGVADVFETRIRSQVAATDASPCPSAGACVVIADERTAPRRLTSNGPLGAIRIVPRRPPAAIERLEMSAVVDPGARGAVDVVLHGNGAGGDTSLRAFDGDISVGESTTSRVEWTPIANGVRELRITTPDDEVHTAVEVRSVQYRVLFYEPRPTWSGTFVRRAIEGDARFLVRARSVVGRNLTVSTDNATLDAETLERTDPHVVVVTALEQLSARDVAVLEPFIARRGGSVVTLLDQRPAGASVGLMPLTVTENRQVQPMTIGPLKASEYLTFAPDAVTQVLARAGDAPVIVSRSAGNGRVVASGASDAWRFRNEGTAFTSFWQALVADAAAAAGEELSVTLDKRLAKPQERVRVAVEWRPLRGVPAAIEARAGISCGDSRRPIRLWPDAIRGRFEGEVIPPGTGECRVTAMVNGNSGSTALLVRAVRTASDGHEGALTASIAAHGGTVVDAGNEGTLVTLLRRSAAASRISTQAHPLRSPWWIVPFAACLGAEWWMRRRSSLK
jgi:hypothetical protein